MAYVTALGLAGLAAVVCFLRPGSTPFLPPCPFYLLTGFYCPGCGSTRMLYFLVHGHPYLAFRQNPLAMLVLPGVLYGLARQMFARPRAAHSLVHPGWITAFCIVVILFGVLRNVPFAPFCALAPGGVCRAPAPVKARSEVREEVRASAGQTINRAKPEPQVPSF